MPKDEDGLHIQTEQELAAQLAHYTSEGHRQGDPNADEEAS